MVCSITRGPAKPISAFGSAMFRSPSMAYDAVRSEEHTSELQSPCNLVCRLLLEKKKKTDRQHDKVLCSGKIALIHHPQLLQPTPPHTPLVHPADSLSVSSSRLPIKSLKYLIEPP